MKNAIIISKKIVLSAMFCSTLLSSVNNDNLFNGDSQTIEKTYKLSNGSCKIILNSNNKEYTKFIN
jgi:hypothetical protein